MICSARRVWDLNPRRLSPHTLSKRAHSAALATLPNPAQRVRTREGIVWASAPVSGRDGRVLCNGRLRTGSGPEGSSSQQIRPGAADRLAVTPGNGRRRAGRWSPRGPSQNRRVVRLHV